MRVRRVVLCCCSLLALASGEAGATPFRISTVQNLAFGTFAAGSGGSVTVSPSGVRTSAGGVNLLASSGGQAAGFLVSGNSNTTYTISLPSSALLGNGSQSMTISNFVSSPSAASASSGYLSGGSQVLYVGATLTVGSGQPSGTYSGSFSVIVNNP